MPTAVSTTLIASELPIKGSDMRMSGPETLTAMTTPPVLSRIGAATHLTLILNSPRRPRNPVSESHALPQEGILFSDCGVGSRFKAICMNPMTNLSFRAECDHGFSQSSAVHGHTDSAPRHHESNGMLRGQLFQIDDPQPIIKYSQVDRLIDLMRN